MRNFVTTLIVGGTLAACSTQSDQPDFDGQWHVTKATMAGQNLPDTVSDTMKLSINGNSYTSESMGQIETGTLKFDFEASPVRIDITAIEGPMAGTNLKAIGEVNTNTARFSYNVPGITSDDYPSTFESTAQNGYLVLTLERRSN